MPSFAENKIKKLLLPTGVEINGSRPFDITIHDGRFYNRVLFGGSLGLGESYMDKWWDCEKLDEFFQKILSEKLEKKATPIWQKILRNGISKIVNYQSKKRAFEVGERHYNIGNELYSLMLDKRMIYSCGYWSGNPPAGGLNEAQEAKLDLICRKLYLKPGQKILDIGCGWGGFAKFAAEKYGVEVLGTTISKEQAELAKKACKGLPVNIQLKDYRDIEGEFDHIVSVGMFEHVGYKNYRTFMKVAEKHLKKRGMFLLHTIGGNESVLNTDPWIHKYIFPNGMIPSMKQIGDATERIFVMEDWHNFGPDYDKTLMEWHKNFNANWDKIRENYDERFYRMWNYYLLSCAGAFRSRKIQLWQIVLSKGDIKEGYKTVR